jgi:hypothetical protein
MSHNKSSNNSSFIKNVKSKCRKLNHIAANQGSLAPSVSVYWVPSDPNDSPTKEQFNTISVSGYVPGWKHVMTLKELCRKNQSNVVWCVGYTVKRVQNKNTSDFHDIQTGITGTVKKGENPVDGALRELVEETGVPITFFRKHCNIRVHRGNKNITPVSVTLKGEDECIDEEFVSPEIRRTRKVSMFFHGDRAKMEALIEANIGNLANPGMNEDKISHHFLMPLGVAFRVSSDIFNMKTRMGSPRGFGMWYGQSIQCN